MSKGTIVAIIVSGVLTGGLSLIGLAIANHKANKLFEEIINHR